MNRIIIFLFVSIGFCISQSNVNIRKVEQILSTEDQSLKGILSDPLFYPNSTDVFSFVRQLEDYRYLYIYTISQKKLTEVLTVEKSQELKISLNRNSSSQLIFNDQLNWRPNNKDDKKWFVFVSNGSEDNHDIYLSYLGKDMPIRLTKHPSIDNKPKWSPDGNSIAFITSRNGKGDIYLIQNINDIINNGDASDIKIKPLTLSPEEEVDIAWNYNPESYLLAYTKRVRFPEKNMETYQICLLDLLKKELNKPIVLTNDPSRHYTRPMWDPYDDTKLLYVGQSVEKDSPGHLYMAQFKWSEDKKLEGKLLEGHTQELFKNLYLKAAPVLWLPGGKAILCQENKEVLNFPVYIVNIDRWLNRRAAAVNYFENLHAKYPLISGFEAMQDNLLFSVQEGKFFKIYRAYIYGSDVGTTGAIIRLMENPNKSSFLWYYVGGPGVAGLGYLIYELFKDEENGNGNGNGKIGNPPSMPNE